MPNIKKISLALLITFLLLTPPAIALAKSGLFSEKDEIRWGQDAAAKVIKEKGLSEDPSLQERASTVFKQLLPYITRKNLPYKIQVIKDKDLNAFTYPGGQVFVTEGLMKSISTDDELAFVLGHELAHNENYHVVKAIERSLWTNLFTIALYQNNKDLASVVGPVMQIGISRGYGFKNEHQADLGGFKLATQAGYNPAGGAVFFHELQDKYGDNSKSIANFVNPHPKNSVRITKQLDYINEYSNKRVGIKISNDKTKKSAAIHIDNKPALTIYAAHGNWNANQRAEWVAGRLVSLLRTRQPIAASEFALKLNDSGYPSIVYGEVSEIITVHSEDATASNVDPQTLAYRWLNNLQASFI